MSRGTKCDWAYVLSSRNFASKDPDFRFSIASHCDPPTTMNKAAFALLVLVCLLVYVRGDVVSSARRLKSSKGYYGKKKSSKSKGKKSHKSRKSGKSKGKGKGGCDRTLFNSTVLVNYLGDPHKAERNRGL